MLEVLKNFEIGRLSSFIWTWYRKIKVGMYIENGPCTKNSNYKTRRKHEKKRSSYVGLGNDSWI